jgi:hypothetical protein
MRVLLSPSRTPAPHVLMSADAVGGVWQYSLDLAAGLIRQGLAVTVAVLGPAPSEARIAAAQADTGACIRVTGLPLDWTAETPGAVLDAAAALARLAREIGADLVHLHSPAMALADFSVPVAAVCHSCVATWWDAVETGPLPADLAWRHDLTARGCRAADALLAPTRAHALATARVCGLARPPVVVGWPRPALGAAAGRRARRLHGRPPLGSGEERHRSRPPRRAPVGPAARRRLRGRAERRAGRDAPPPASRAARRCRDRRGTRRPPGLRVARPLRAVRSRRAGGRRFGLRPRPVRQAGFPGIVGRRRRLRGCGRRCRRGEGRAGSSGRSRPARSRRGCCCRSRCPLRRRGDDRGRARRLARPPRRAAA